MGEFGGDENRLPSLNAEFLSRFGEPRVLALVICHNPFQTVVGIELPVTHHPGLVRLDAKAQIDNGMHIWMSGYELHNLRNGVAGFAAGTVDRVVPAPTWRQFLVDRCL